MSFRENLKQELTYLDIQVKELSTKSGVNVRTINNYLSKQGSMPSAEAAVKIANVLGVSVEYLVTGETQGAKRNTRPIFPEINSLVEKISILPSKKRNAICKTVEKMIEEISLL